MIRVIKFIIKLFILALLLLIIGTVSIIMLVNPNNYKSQISSLVERQTSRHLHINGDIKWSLLPQMGIYLNDIVLSKEGSLEQLLESKQVYLTIKPIDYLVNAFLKKKTQGILLKLKEMSFDGTKTKFDVESNINLNQKRQINGNMRLLPIKYKSDNKTTPLTVMFIIDQEQIQIMIDEKKIDMQLVSQLFMSEPFFSGEGTITAHLSSVKKQNTNKGLLNNLTGSLNISIKNGKINGIDILNTLTQTEHNVHDLFEIIKNNPKQNIGLLLSNNSKTVSNVLGENYFSEFSSFNFQTFFKDGVSLQSSVLLQHPAYAMRGFGKIDLSKNLLDYKFNAVLNKFADNESQQVEHYVKRVPLLIKAYGSIEHLTFSVDFQGYLHSALEELQKNLFSGAINSILKH